MSGKIIGAVIGIVFGIMLFWFGWGAAFAVLALGIFGWFIGKWISHEIDVLGYLDSLYHRRGHPR